MKVFGGGLEWCCWKLQDSEGGGEVEVGPLAEGKKCVKLSLDTLVYKTFKVLCKNRGYGHPSNVIEAFMRACLENPVLPLVIKRIAEGE